MSGPNAMLHLRRALEELEGKKKARLHSLPRHGRFFVPLAVPNNQGELTCTSYPDEDSLLAGLRAMLKGLREGAHQLPTITTKVRMELHLAIDALELAGLD